MTFAGTLTNYFAQAKFDGPAILVFLVLVFMLGVIINWHTDGSKFDMRRVLIDKETNQVSLSKFGQFIALVVSTAAIWYEMMHARLTEWLFVGYMIAWSGANLASRWIDTNSNRQPSGYSAPPPRPQQDDGEERVLVREKG
jgi:hypothetical protein